TGDTHVPLCKYPCSCCAFAEGGRCHRRSVAVPAADPPSLVRRRASTGGGLPLPSTPRVPPCAGRAGSGAACQFDRSPVDPMLRGWEGGRAMPTCVGGQRPPPPELDGDGAQWDHSSP